MDARFEDDLIEIAGDGNYLMLCSERKTLFLDGSAVGKVGLGEITTFRAEGEAIVVELTGGGTHVQPFPSAPAGFTADAAAKLNAGAVAWR